MTNPRRPLLETAFRLPATALSWHSLVLREVERTLQTNLHLGLANGEAAERLHTFGRNELPSTPPASLPVVFLRQFKSPLIYVLLASSFVVWSLGEVVDAAIILFVLLFNAVIGAVQEGRAQSTLDALRDFVKTNATVIRDNREVIIPDTEVVPGDVLVALEGERIPADARVIQSDSCAVDEATLTGESKPVHKVVEVLPSAALAAEQVNMVFRGTHVVSGHAKAVVVATGLQTAVGRISRSIATLDTEIPLKAELRALSRFIVIAVVSLGIVLFAFGIATGLAAKTMLATVVALAVSVIPEGLPIVLTLILAAGVWRMARRNALVKNLQAVEALGQADVIAVDKTGTITKNEMVVRQVTVGERTFLVSGVGYAPAGELSLATPDGGQQVVSPPDFPELILAGRVGALCATAGIAYDTASHTWRVSGDPTDAALLVMAKKAGFAKADVEATHPRLEELPFDYTRKYHATVHRVDAKRWVSVVGAPEVILGMCQSRWTPTGVVELSDGDRHRLEAEVHGQLQAGLRVIAFAFLPDAPGSMILEDLSGLVFGGTWGMQDALRPEVASAVARAQAAGIRVVMITGDHAVTAEALAREAGIWNPGDAVMTGHELISLSPEQLQARLPQVSVFARVTPEHKLQIIQAYRALGRVIAMTGDGVNDAPSLVAADLGVAMGKIGTEVARSASDIVLLDDNFSSIVAAVEEGRNMAAGVRRVVLYLLSTGLGEALVISVALFARWDVPLLPSQIIWLNLVTDSFLVVAFATEPMEQLGIHRHGRRRSLVDASMVVRMLVMAVPMTIGTLALFHAFADDPAKALSISLTSLAVFQWLNAYNCRSETASVLRTNPLSNPALTAATAVVIILQLVALYTPWLQAVLRTTPLSWQEWLLILPVAASVVVAEEIRKLVVRRWPKPV